MSEKLLITGFPEGKKVQAVKVIRAITGLSLKEAKHAADGVEAGQQVEIRAANGYELPLAEAGVAYQISSAQIGLDDFVALLEKYPRHQTVGDLVDALSAALRMPRGRGAA